MSLNPLEPLYAPWEEPNFHRIKNPAGGAALVQNGRRPSRCLLVPYVRDQVSLWREAGYPGVSDTTKALLYWWFETAHPTETGEFRYHYAQREAVETIIWLYEVVGYRALSDLIGSLLPEDDPRYEVLVNSISDDEDQWGRYCSKVATGGGKTKCMSLLVAWSYFNSLYENEEVFPRHFVIIAPNLIVFERLKDDFEGGRIFHSDPVLPPEFAGDFNLEVVLQDESGGASYTGSLYLTNIHRLFERSSGDGPADDSPSWAGPVVNRGQVFRTGERLRARISDHPSVMVINDEAHHLHDPDSAWNEAIRAINDQSRSKGNRGVLIQADYTATPKHNDGTLFRHIVSDFPLGEAVDAGIVKVPVIGRSDEIKKDIADDAFAAYRTHLLLGYHQYKNAYAEWSGTRKPILFVMTESAQEANEIASQLNNLEYLPNDTEPNLLKGRVLNLHTRLKGKIVNRKVGKQKFKEFVYSESASGISDDDLREIRRWSQELDREDSPYRCIVSVLMLREGWDVRNVTTIVPLRPYSAESNILAEQTLGRGLRRMEPPGSGVLERVTVVEHPAFVKFYEEEMQQEGLPIIVDEIEKSKPLSVTIFVDHKNKPVEDLEIELPLVSDSIETTATLDGLEFEDIVQKFRSTFKPLPIRERRDGTIIFTEKTLFTDEIISSIEIDRGLLRMGATSISVYVRQLEKACRLVSAHQVLAPLLQKFIEEILFERPVNLYSGEVDHRMGDVDVVQHILETFGPLIRDKTITKTDRVRRSQGYRLSTWKNYQATKTDRRPCVPLEKTMFNLVPCDSPLEKEVAEFLNDCEDVVSIAKNAGPQKLTIDYLAPNGRKALYWPDFLVRASSGDMYLLEAKGAEDINVAHKAKAAVEWCKTASSKQQKWQYVYVSQVLFEQVSDLSVESLASSCQPKLAALLRSLVDSQLPLPFDQTSEEIRRERTEGFTEGIDLSCCTEDERALIEQAVNQLEYDKRRNSSRLQAAFSVLLEPFEAIAGAILVEELLSYVPPSQDEQRYYFDPYLEGLSGWQAGELRKHQRNLRRNIVLRAHSNRLGNLLFCFSYAVGPDFANLGIAGIWADVREAFSEPDLQHLQPILDSMNNFRNTYVAHGDTPLTDLALAEENLRKWIEGLVELRRSLE